MYGTMTNRVAIAKPVMVRSANGPLVTVIAGRAVASTTNGDGAIRCVYVGANVVLSGFTLTNGHTRIAGESGGGAWCEVSGVVSNCTFRGNSADLYGGGAAGGTLNNCTFTGNSATNGGGAYSCTLNNCTLSGNSADYGGGAFSCALNKCALGGNSAYRYGGGAANGTLNNCTLSANWADYGGGAANGTLNNCTLSANWADYGGGAANGLLNNRIVYYNSALNSPNYWNSTLKYSCSTPLPDGLGNSTTPPLFVNTNGWSDLRLQASSPCINAGNNIYVLGETDLDGNPRIVQDTVDMGAYEAQEPLILAQPASQIVMVGRSATFTVTAAGAPPLSYFWRRDGALIPGATRDAYATDNVQLSDSGNGFTCLVSNALGTLLSSNAVLT